MITIFFQNDRSDARRIHDYFLADRYILIDKTISATILQFYMNEIVKRCISKGREIQLLVRNQNSHHIINISEVYYVSSNLRKIQIVGKENRTNNKINVECYNKLSNIEEPLNCLGFCRVSGSFIVALNYIKRIEKMTVIMKDGESLPIGRQYHKTLVERLSNYEMMLNMNQKP